MKVSRFIQLWLLLLLPLLVGCPGRPEPVLRGSLGGELSWRGTVYLAGDVTLLPGSHLRIAPGTRVLFLSPGPGDENLQDHPNFPGSELIVQGTIAALGTPTAPITFAAADADAPAGSWGAVNLASSPDARFRCCIFRQADSAIHSRQSRVNIEDSVFAKNLVGIRFFDSPIRIQHNLLRENGTAIRFHLGAPVIVGNRLRDNVRGLFITADPRDYRIEGNDIVGSREYSVVLGENVPTEVRLPGNYWGTTDLEAIRDRIFDRQRDAYLGLVRIMPVAEAPIAGAGPRWSR